MNARHGNSREAPARLGPAAGAAPAAAASDTSASPPPSDLIELGVLRGAYGLQGWAHVQPHSAQSEVLRAVRRWWLQRETGAPFAITVREARLHGAALVAKWEGCESPEAADALRGCRILVSRTDFPEAAPGTHYWVDLMGMRVINRSGEDLGTVTGLRNNGAHDILELRDAAGTERLIPVAGPYVDSIDGAAREVRVDWEANW